MLKYAHAASGEMERACKYHRSMISFQGKEEELKLPDDTYSALFKIDFLLIIKRNITTLDSDNMPILSHV